MDARQRISPILVGRDELLALAERRALAAQGGRGHLLFLAGEAGIGKTRLLGAIVRGAQRLGLEATGASAFPRDLELAGALLLDLGDQLTRSKHRAWAAAGRRLLERMAGAADVAGDSHRQRRLLVMDVVDLIAGLADERPVALALEDLHWADDLTLEVVGQLARRLPERPLLVAGTYRSDELYPRVPMREWRSRLIAQRLAEEVRLPRLDLSQTGMVATLLLGGELPAPHRLVGVLHRRSDGIPLHIEELLGAMGDIAEGDEARPARLPDTLAEAILQRASGLSTPARRLLASASVIGRSFDLDLVCAVHRATPRAVGRSLAELEQRFFVVTPTDGWFDFRHALIRDAVEATIDPGRRRALHGRVAEAAAARPEVGSDAFLSAHYELAGMRDRAFHHARLAASRAAAMSAHREALDLARRARRTAPANLPPRERAALLRLVAAEEAATDNNAGAAATLEEARAMLAAAGDRISAAELLPPLVAARHLLGDGLETRAGLIATELETLERAGTAATGTRARLLAALSAAYMLDRRVEESIAYGREARALAEREGDSATALHAQTTVGACLAIIGKVDDAWPMLADAVREARDGRREAEAARAYRMIGTAASCLVEYDVADRWLAEGIEYAERTEQWNHHHYMASHAAHVAWCTGAWDTAETLADQSLADGRGGLTTTITALHVRGYVALGRGDHRRATDALAEARRIGEEMQELQRFSPALWGLAESALLDGRPSEAAALTERGLVASRAVRDAMYLFPFLVTGTRARLAVGDPLAAERWVAEVTAALLDRSIPGTLPAIDHARGLLALASGATGKARTHLARARQGWVDRRRWWEAAWSAVDLAGCAFRANRPAEASAIIEPTIQVARDMGAAPVVSAAEELATRLRARHPVDDAWAPLSAREFEVARLVAAGHTNREIAGELEIAPKTVGAHVEHILDKLGASRRAEIAAWVAERGQLIP
jgi:DNA-binding CsgD family transcriptional regulator/tetratricopeptide (TPR) repeat protein